MRARGEDVNGAHPLSLGFEWELANPRGGTLLGFAFDPTLPRQDEQRPFRRISDAAPRSVTLIDSTVTAERRDMQEATNVGHVAVAERPTVSRQDRAGGVVAEPVTM